MKYSSSRWYPYPPAKAMRVRVTAAASAPRGSQARADWEGAPAPAGTVVEAPLRDTVPDARIGQHQSRSVVSELAFELEGRSLVAIALGAVPVPEAAVALLQPLDGEVRCADVGRGCVRRLPHLESEAMDGKRIGHARRLQIHVAAPVEIRRAPSVDAPPTPAIGLELHVVPADRGPPADARPPRDPDIVELE